MPAETPPVAPFTGVGVALTTLFDGQGRVDFEATAAHAVTIVELGISAVLVGGTAGEFSFLSEIERDELLSAVVKRVDGGATIIAGVGAESTLHAIRLTEAARNSGANCILSTPPKAGDVVEHYEEVKRRRVRCRCWLITGQPNTRLA